MLQNSEEFRKLEEVWTLDVLRKLEIVSKYILLYKIIAKIELINRQTALNISL